MARGGRRPGAGRKKGSLNKTTIEARAAALARFDRVLDMIEELAANEQTSDSVKLGALKELLYTGLGKPWQAAPPPSPEQKPQEKVVYWRWARTDEEAIPDPYRERLKREEQERQEREHQQLLSNSDV